MLHSRYIVCEDFPDGTTRVIYAGSSSIEAQNAMGKSIDEAKAEAVLYFSHPAHSQVRFPAREKIEIAERAEHAKKSLSAEAESRKQQAALKRARAAELAAEADQLEGKAEPEEEQPEQTEKSQGGKTEKSQGGKTEKSQGGKNAKSKKSAE